MHRDLLRSIAHTRAHAHVRAHTHARARARTRARTHIQTAIQPPLLHAHPVDAVVGIREMSPLRELQIGSGEQRNRVKFKHSLLIMNTYCLITCCS